MEDFQWLFYILGAVIILVVRMWLKAFQTPKPNPTNRPTIPKVYPVPAPPATSYQVILKEMQASGERAKEVVQPTSLEKNVRAKRTTMEAKSLERTESRAKSLEKIVITPREVIKKPSAIELARQSKPRLAEQEPATVNYGKLLQNPQNMRAAFIVAEILNRRVDY